MNNELYQSVLAGSGEVSELRELTNVNESSLVGKYAIWQGYGKINHPKYEEIGRIVSDNGDYVTIKFKDGKKIEIIPRTDFRLVKESVKKSFKAGDKVKVKNVLGKDRVGTIKNIHRLGDMADIDFGSGDIYGIMLNKIVGGVGKSVNESKVELLTDDPKLIKKYKVGDTFTTSISFPGHGELIYKVTKITNSGIYGKLIKDTSGILSHSDVI